MINATTKTSAGDDARIGVAIDIGNVRNAQNVNTHDVPTITLFTAESETTSADSPDAMEIRPHNAKEQMYAAHPKQVEQRSVGRTALFCTLAFFAMSYNARNTELARIHSVQTGMFAQSFTRCERRVYAREPQETTRRQEAPQARRARLLCGRLRGAPPPRERKDRRRR